MLTGSLFEIKRPILTEVVGELVYQYYDVILQQDIGKFKKGEIVPVAVMDFETGTLELFESRGLSVPTCTLHLKLVPL